MTKKDTEAKLADRLERVTKTPGVSWKSILRCEVENCDSFHLKQCFIGTSNQKLARADGFACVHVFGNDKETWLGEVSVKVPHKSGMVAEPVVNLNPENRKIAPPKFFLQSRDVAEAIAKGDYVIASKITREIAGPGDAREPEDFKDLVSEATEGAEK